MKRLDDLPVTPDMSGNQEYEALCLEIRTKEAALKAENTGADYRMALRGQLETAQHELDEVKDKLQAVIKNAELF